MLGSFKDFKNAAVTQMNQHYRGFSFSKNTILLCECFTGFNQNYTFYCQIEKRIFYLKGFLRCFFFTVLQFSTRVTNGCYLIVSSVSEKKKKKILPLLHILWQRLHGLVLWGWFTPGIFCSLIWNYKYHRTVCPMPQNKITLGDFMTRCPIHKYIEWPVKKRCTCNTTW